MQKRNQLPLQILREVFSVGLRMGEETMRNQLKKPTHNFPVYELAREAGISRKTAKRNSKFDWSFEEPGKLVVLNIWWHHIDISRERLSGSRPSKRSGNSAQRGRAEKFHSHLASAYENKLPAKVILLVKKKRRRPTQSPVGLRELDSNIWAVTKYDYQTETFILQRNARPVTPVARKDQPPVSGKPEGMESIKLRKHRLRDQKFRRYKIQSVLATSGGRLVCEVPKCGFDFEKKYGGLGKGYAHVHHKKPLSFAPKKGQKTLLKDLAIVCANCHAMIHAGNKCRPLKGLIPN